MEEDLDSGECAWRASLKPPSSPGLPRSRALSRLLSGALVSLGAREVGLQSARAEGQPFPDSSLGSSLTLCGAVRDGNFWKGCSEREGERRPRQPHKAGQVCWRLSAWQVLQPAPAPRTRSPQPPGATLPQLGPPCSGDTDPLGRISSTGLCTSSAWHAAGTLSFTEGDREGGREGTAPAGNGPVRVTSEVA